MTPAASSQQYTLKATPKTVAWGYYDAAAPPVLRIHSGDTVEFDTLITNSPTGLEKAGVPPEQVEQNLRDIYKEVTNKGPGGHILNGPVFMEEAEPGDTLEVRIQKIDLAIPYAYNAFRAQPRLSAGGLSLSQDARSFRSTASAWWRSLRRALRFLCIRFSAAWAWRRRRLRPH